jgi:hypothetical protein
LVHKGQDQGGPEEGVQASQGGSEKEEDEEKFFKENTLKQSIFS